LARLSLEEGHAADAETVIRKCKEQFHQDGQADDELAASVTLMEGLLDEASPWKQPRKSKRVGRWPRKYKSTQPAPVRSSLCSCRTGHRPYGGGAPKLQRTLDSARAHLLLGIELETRLTLQN